MASEQTKTIPNVVITVTANFTAEPIGDVLRYWLDEIGATDAKVEFSGYNQVFQELVLPTSVLASSTPGANLILIRPEEWLRDQNPELHRVTISKAVDDLVGLLRTFVARSKRPTLLAICHPSKSVNADGDLRAHIQHEEERLRVELENVQGLTLLTAEDIVGTFALVDIDDEMASKEGHIPFSESYWIVLGTAAIRSIRTQLQPAKKVLILDADNTLWGGVVGEVGAENVKIDGVWREIQEIVKARKRAGMLLAVVSKNQIADVSAVLARPETILREEDFVALKANWQPKSENIRALSSELELGPDSFVFLDDNPLECAEVSANCPGVVALNLPSSESDMVPFLRNVWALDLPAATSADESRTEQYRQIAQRKQFQTNVSTFAEFLKQLDLKTEFQVPQADQMDRASQLTQRTNQFNLTGKRRTVSELSSSLRAGELEGFLVSVSDKFGDYGEVGLCLFRRQEGELLVDTFVLSCRALGKGVEHRMLNHLAEIAAEYKANSLILPLVQTARNEPAQKFLNSMPAEHEANNSYRISTDSAKTVAFAPSDRPVEDSVNQPPTSHTGSVVDYHSIAMRSLSIDRIAAAIRKAGNRDRAGVSREYVAPRNHTEQILAMIWSDVLRVERVGVEDDFFELGGDSIKSVQIAAKAAQKGLQFSIREQFQHRTIAALVSQLSSQVQATPEETRQSSTPFSLSKLGKGRIDEIMASLAKGGK